MKEEKQIIRSDLFTEFGKFFVSTMYRHSSSIMDDYYHETLAWSLDENGQRDKIVADNSGSHFLEKALQQHFEVCKVLSEKGEFIN